MNLFVCRSVIRALGAWAILPGDLAGSSTNVRVVGVFSVFFRSFSAYGLGRAILARSSAARLVPAK